MGFQKCLFAASYAGAIVLGLGFVAEARAAIQVASPDDRVRFELVGGANVGLTYRVGFKDKFVIETSPLGILLDDVELSHGAEIGNADRYQVNEDYPWRGIQRGRPTVATGRAFR